MLKGILDGDDSAIPASKFIDVGYVGTQKHRRILDRETEMAALLKKD